MAEGVCPVDSSQSPSFTPARMEGVVLQSLTAGRYQYVELDSGTGTSWVAVVSGPMEKGSRLSFEPEMLMEKFDSPVLKRTFDKVYFGSVSSSPADEPQMPANHPAVPGMAPHNAGTIMQEVSAPAAGIAKIEGGVTIADLDGQKDKLTGTDVKLRARVVKSSFGIMGANWLHVKDSSAGRDLVISTKAEAKPGDTVIIKGRLERDVNLGYGYAYDIAIRDCDVTVENTSNPESTKANSAGSK